MAKAEQQAERLLVDAHIVGPPVDVETIAKRLGVMVIYERLDADVSGMLYRRDNEPAIIAVNSTHPLVRQRFTIAHELGHHQLHRGRAVIVDHLVRARVNFRDITSSLATDGEEIEANRFSANLLMPGEWVARRLSRALVGPASASQVISQLAETFVVSRQAMENRLINLGLRAAP